MKIKGAIFDMDGTIVDSLMFWDYLWKRIGEEYMNDSTFRPTEEVDKKVRTMIFVDAMTYFREYYSLDVKVEDFIRFTSDGINDFYKNIAKVKPGAREYLDYLKEQNVKMCLASATAMPAIKYALECHDLLKYFDVILSCADIGVGKDKPDIYVKAMTEMNISCDELCVFEDSFVALETAKSVGFNTVGIYDKYNFEQERLRAASDIYLGECDRMDSLISVIKTA
ncbi:MAG: HAD family phosphatase [Clostridia bacterium]|nr:HAD family phosphatase [Clostridia bacterium]